MKLEDALKWMDENESCDDTDICPISKQPILNKFTLTLRSSLSASIKSVIVLVPILYSSFILSRDV